MNGETSKEFNMFLAARLLAHGRNTIFFDIGANIGMFTFYVIRSGFECHTFEPHPYYQQVLQTRRRLLGLEQIFRSVGRIYLNNLAISNRSGPAQLFHHGGKPGSHSMIRDLVIAEGEKNPNAFAIEETTLDQYVSAFSWSAETHFFLKIDVEGVEADVIRGGLGFIQRVKPDLFIEVRGQADGNTFKEIADMLLPMGYLIYGDEYLTIEVRDGKLANWSDFTHADILFSVRQIDTSPFACGWPILSRSAKFMRLFKRLFLLQFADLHHLAIRKPYDVFY